jgi:carbamoyltransferase
MNSVANGRVIAETPIEELYIQPGAGDGGGALGAALLVWNSALDNDKRLVMDHAFWGKEYGPEAISAAVNNSNHTAVHYQGESDLLDAVVDRIEDGKVIGWFQGRSEWGPRALGNRSILADPRREEMKDLVNTKIKFREPFRPFAPSVLAERCAEFFDLPDPESSLPARFMLVVVPVLPNKIDVIPAVSHMGTARVQTVHKEASPRFHRLIERFGERTGVPVVLNTSFNVRGEPIVESPADALMTFDNSGLDCLVLGDYVIDKLGEMAPTGVPA